MDRRRRILKYQMIESEQAGRELPTVGGNSYVSLFESHPRICLFSIPHLAASDSEVISARREFAKAASEVVLRKADTQVVFAFLDAANISQSHDDDEVKLSFYRHAFMKKYKMRHVRNFIPGDREGSVSVLDYKDGLIRTLPIFKALVHLGHMKFEMLHYPSKGTICEELEKAGVILPSREKMIDEVIAERYSDPYRHSSARQPKHENL